MKIIVKKGASELVLDASTVTLEEIESYTKNGYIVTDYIHH